MSKARKGLRKSISRLNRAQLLTLLKFILVLIQQKRGSKRLTKAMRKSLAITERELGVRLPKKQKRGKKGRPPKGKVPPQLRPYLFKKGHRKVRKKKR